MAFRAVIFDLFGTLIYNFSRREFDDVVGQMAGALSAPAEAFRESWVQTFDERAVGSHPTLEASIQHICKSIGVEAGDDRVTEAAAIRLDYARRSIKPHRGALETLAELRNLGIKTGLITDCTCEIPLIWDSTPFAPLIDSPVFSPLAGVKKPDPRIYHLACEKLEVEPEKCLYVGDGSSCELTGAVNAGMTAVLLQISYDHDYDSYRIDEDTWQGPLISSLSEVLELTR